MQGPTGLSSAAIFPKAEQHPATVQSPLPEITFQLVYMSSSDQEAAIFLYSGIDYDIMRRDIEMCGEIGVDGIVLGILSRMAKLMSNALPD